MKLNPGGGCGCCDIFCYPCGFPGGPLKVKWVNVIGGGSQTGTGNLSYLGKFSGFDIWQGNIFDDVTHGQVFAFQINCSPGCSWYNARSNPGLNYLYEHALSCSGRLPDLRMILADFTCNPLSIEIDLLDNAGHGPGVFWTFTITPP